MEQKKRGKERASHQQHCKQFRIKSGSSSTEAHRQQTRQRGKKQKQIKIQQ